MEYQQKQNSNEINTSIYFEKQSLQMCAQHCLNNLFQKPLYDKLKLNKLCEKLTPTKGLQINPHKNPLGLGNYDINVITTAIQEQQLDIQWYDRRKQVKQSLSFQDDDLYGLIVNLKIPKTVLGVKIYSSQHWISIRKLDDHIYLFDSINQQEQKMSESEVLSKLQGILDQDLENNIFLVKKKK